MKGGVPSFGLLHVALAATLVAPAVFSGPSGALAAEYTEDVERDFALRSMGQLQVTNLRGDIVIEGWAQDKIRLKAHRRATAQTREEARRLFSALDFRYRSIEGGQIELSAEYGRGLTLQERLHERQNPRTGTEMHVFAPAGLDLKVWAVNGRVVVKGWNADLEIRTSSGPIQVENVKAGKLAILCDSCTIQVKTFKGSLHCDGGSGSLALNDVQGPQIYAEVRTGSIQAVRVHGEQLYVSRSGAITARQLSGRIEFHTLQGRVEVLDSSGFLSGKTESGSILAKMTEWEFLDKALLESQSGNISLSVPPQFSGEVDILSLHGKVLSGFPVQRLRRKEGDGADALNHLIGRVGEGGESLRIFSENGDVSFQPTAPPG